MTTPATAGAGAGQPTAPTPTPTPGPVSAGSVPTTPVYAAGTVTTRGTVKLAQLRAHGLKLSLTGLARGARATARLTLKLAGGKTRRLGTVRLKLTRAGRQKVTLHLPRSARLRLAPGRLQVSLRVTAPGTQPSSRTVVVQVRG
jgi:hypothetical protein